MNLKVLFGNKIKKYRKDLGMTRESFAEKLDMHPSNLARIEAGLQFPKPETIDNLVRFLGVSYSELFNFEENIDERLKSDTRETLIKYALRLSQNDLKFFLETIKLYIKMH